MAKHPVKCGWCLTGHHDNCAKILTLGDYADQPCSCSCPKGHEHVRPASLGNIKPSRRPADTPTPRRPTPARAQAPNLCACGCGDTCKGTYRPGHDSRHISAIVAQVEREIARTPDISKDDRTKLVGVLVQPLINEALANKAVARIMKRGLL